MHLGMQAITQGALETQGKERKENLLEGIYII